MVRIRRTCFEGEKKHKVGKFDVVEVFATLMMKLVEDIY